MPGLATSYTLLAGAAKGATGNIGGVTTAIRGLTALSTAQIAIPITIAVVGGAAWFKFAKMADEAEQGRALELKARFNIPDEEFERMRTQGLEMPGVPTIEEQAQQFRSLTGAVEQTTDALQAHKTATDSVTQSVDATQRSLASEAQAWQAATTAANEHGDAVATAARQRMLMAEDMIDAAQRRGMVGATDIGAQYVESYRQRTGPTDIRDADWSAVYQDLDKVAQALSLTEEQTQRFTERGVEAARTYGQAWAEEGRASPASSRPYASRCPTWNNKHRASRTYAHG